jgi:hypothetical protein
MWRLWFLMMTCLCSASLALAQVQTTYILVPIPDGFPAALDPSGPLVAAGAIKSDDPGRPDHPALLTEAGPIVLGLLPEGTFGNGTGVCGAYTTGFASTGPFGLRTHAFLAVAGEPVLRDLGEGERFSAGADVNCRGEVAGYGDDATLSRLVPLWWDVDGAVQELPTFEATGTGGVSAINAAGDMLGSATVGRTSHCAWWPAATHAIQDCGVGPGADDLSGGFALNNTGPHLVGTVVFDADGRAQHPFLREPDGTIVLLPTLPDEAACVAVGINDAGVIVGACATDAPEASAPFSSQCTLWQDDASPAPPVPVALSALVTNGEGWDLRRCLGVNRNGVILGDGTRHGEPMAFLAIPVGGAGEVSQSATPAPPVKRQPQATPQETPTTLATLVAHWQRHRAATVGKIERWEQALAAWKAAHGR